MIHSKNIPDECTQTITNATQNVAYNDYTSQTGRLKFQYDF